MTHVTDRYNQVLQVRAQVYYFGEIHDHEQSSINERVIVEAAKHIMTQQRDTTLRRLFRRLDHPGTRFPLSRYNKKRQRQGKPVSNIPDSLCCVYPSIRVYYQRIDVVADTTSKLINRSVS